VWDTSNGIFTLPLLSGFGQIVVRVVVVVVVVVILGFISMNWALLFCQNQLASLTSQSVSKQS